MLSVRITRKRVLNWLRGESPNWCKLDLTKNGCYCPLGYAAKINRLPKTENNKSNPWKYDICANLLGINNHIMVYAINDDYYNNDPKVVADRLENLFEENPV